MIKVADVTKHFDKFRVLDHMNISVPKGAIYGLVGPNGAGAKVHTFAPKKIQCCQALFFYLHQL